MKKFVKVMYGTKSGAKIGLDYKVNEINISDNWNPTAANPKDFGGFNYSEEDSIIRWLHRGDTIYDVEIPEDAENVKLEGATTIYRTNKIIIKNPKKITDDMALEFYKKSHIPEKSYYKTLAVVSLMNYNKTAKKILSDKVNKNNIKEVLEEWNDFFSHKGQEDRKESNETIKMIYEQLKKIMYDSPKFLVAGFPINFFNSSYGKKRENIFTWLKEINLDGIELQCTYGIRMKDEQAILYKKLAEENNLTITIHAPYYISLASIKSDVVERSKQEIVKAFALAEKLGATRIIFHPGAGYGTGKEDRKNGLKRLIDALNDVEKNIDTKSIKLYPEIGGKVNQLGSLDEIIEICKNVKYARPCIDLAHLHAREIGSMTSKDAIINVLKKIEKELGRDILEETHFHVYPVDYTEKGEKIHKAFGDKVENNQLSLFDNNSEYFPKAEDYIDAIKNMKISPITVCEAHNTQDIGAILMKKLYNDNNI